MLQLIPGNSGLNAQSGYKACRLARVGQGAIYDLPPQHPREHESERHDWDQTEQRYLTGEADPCSPWGHIPAIGRMS